MNRKKIHYFFLNFDPNLFDKKSVFSFLSLFEFEEQIFFCKKRFCKLIHTISYVVFFRKNSDDNTWHLLSLGICR